MSWRKKYDSQSGSRGIIYLGAMDWLIGHANWSECFHDGLKVERGQLLIGRKKLSEKWRVSEQEVRTILKNLKNDGFLTTTSTNKGTVVTILNYDIYIADEEVVVLK